MSIEERMYTYNFSATHKNLRNDESGVINYYMCE